MLKALFKPSSTLPSQTPVQLTSMDKQLMVDVLCSAASLMPFTQSEAGIAATYMSARSYREGQIMFAEGSRNELDRMLWILQGEATFEALAGRGTSKSITVKVIGAGMAFGIMSMFDGEARSLQGIASAPCRCALLTSAQLRELCQAHPQVGVKLMAVICFNFSQSLRELTTKFKCHVRLNNVLHAELMGKESENFQVEE